MIVYLNLQISQDLYILVLLEIFTADLQGDHFYNVHLLQIIYSQFKCVFTWRLNIIFMPSCLLVKTGD